MREKYETLSLATLKELAKGRGMRGISTLKKGELIEAMLLQDEKDAANKRQSDTDSSFFIVYYLVILIFYISYLIKRRLRMQIPLKENQ